MRVRDNYKKLKISYDKVCFTVYSNEAGTTEFETLPQLENKYRLAEQEKLAMESEVSQLRASPLHERDSPYDVARSSTILTENQARLSALQSRVKDLEAYLLEQVCDHTVTIVIVVCLLCWCCHRASCIL